MKQLKLLVLLVFLSGLPYLTRAQEIKSKEMFKSLFCGDVSPKHGALESFEESEEVEVDSNVITYRVVGGFVTTKNIITCRATGSFITKGIIEKETAGIFTIPKDITKKEDHNSISLQNLFFSNGIVSSAPISFFIQNPIKINKEVKINNANISLIGIFSINGSKVITFPKKQGSISFIAPSTPGVYILSYKENGKNTIFSKEILVY